ncbi:MAG: YhgE/Pip domain-containing protein [Lactobacillales bacterium]|jgi:putative membrane protein|nr:YhgE/Pip domain-containing protein [Lactobacillales bacterium]
MKHIKNIATLSKLEWKRILKNPVALFLLVALLILPSLYAWFNIQALWDPYGKTGDLPIAVYSADETTTFKDKKVNIGEELTQKLHKNKSLGWRFVSSKKALEQGVKSGKYYAGIYLPNDFSKDLLSFTTGEIKKPKIEYVVNEKINAIAPKITDKGAESLQGQISEEFTKTASDTLMNVFNQIGVDLESNLISINKVKNVILTADANLDEYDNYANKVLSIQAQLPTIESKLAQVNEFADYLPEVDKLGEKVVALNGKVPEFNRQAAVILTVQKKIPEIENAGKQLAMVNSDMDKIEKTMDGAIDESQTALTILKQAENVLPTVEKLAGDARSMIDLTDQALAKIKESLPSITATIATNLELVKNISKNIATITSAINQLLEDNQLTDSEREQLGELVNRLNEIVKAQQNMLSSLITTLQNLQETAHSTVLEQTIATLQTLKTNVDRLQQRTQYLVDNFDKLSVEEIQSTLSDINELANNINSFANSIDIQAISQQVAALVDQLQTDLSSAKSLLDKAQAIDYQKLLSSTESTLTDAISMLKKYRAQMPMLREEVKDADALLNGHMNDIIGGINKGVSLYQNDLPTAEAKLAKASEFIQNDWPSLKQEMTMTLAVVNKKMPEISKAVNTSSTLIKEDWPMLKQGIQKAAKAIREGEKEVDLEELIKLLKLDANKESDFFAHPVKVETSKMYPIPNYGSASTPFYTALALWVGAVLFSSIAGTDFYLEKGMKGFSKREMYLTRFSTFALVGLGQALIVTLGNLFILHTYVENPVYELVFALFISFVFMSLIYMLVGMFGNVGKGIAIIILVLSISGGGGNFPIVLSGDFFQLINPYLPFTHAVNLLRESTGGIYWPNTIGFILKLLVVGIGASVFGVLAAPLIAPLAKKVGERAEESHIFH